MTSMTASASSRSGKSHRRRGTAHFGPAVERGVLPNLPVFQFVALYRKN